MTTRALSALAWYLVCLMFSSSASGGARPEPTSPLHAAHPPRSVRLHHGPELHRAADAMSFR